MVNIEASTGHIVIQLKAYLKWVEPKLPVSVKGYHKGLIPDVYLSNHFVSYFLPFFPSLSTHAACFLH